MSWRGRMPFSMLDGHSRAFRQVCEQVQARLVTQIVPSSLIPCLMRRESAAGKTAGQPVVDPLVQPGLGGDWSSCRWRC